MIDKYKNTHNKYVDLAQISAGLKLARDGIWYSKDVQPISYPLEGHDNYFEIEDHSFWFRHRNDCIASLVNVFPPTGNGPIFDIGGGNGCVSLGLSNAGYEVVLVEPGPNGVRNAKTRGVKNIVCATTDTANFKPSSLPAVGLFDVIEHVENDLTFLQSIKSLVQQDGRVYATVPAYLLLWSDEDISAGHFRRYSLKGITNVLETAGFEVEFASYIFRFLPLPIFLLRTLPYKLGIKRSVADRQTKSRDHQVKEGLISRTIGFLLNAEVENLNQHKAMRFGASCLIVAKNS